MSTKTEAFKAELVSILEELNKMVDMPLVDAQEQCYLLIEQIEETLGENHETT